MEDLSSHISKWQLHSIKYCSNTPQDDLFFFLSILPTDLADDVEKECATYEGALKYADFKISRLASKRKADAELKEWQSSLKTTPKTAYTLHIGETPPSQPPSAPQPTTINMQQIDNTIAAAIAKKDQDGARRRRRSASPRGRRDIHPDWPRGTCFECGKTGQPIRSCPVRDAIIQETADKTMPANHKTPYDRFCEASNWKPSNPGNRVSSITSDKPIGSGEQPTVVTAVLKDENVPDVVPVWPVLHKPEDATARFFTAAFIQDEGDEDTAMAKHLQDFPTPQQHAPYDLCSNIEDASHD